MKKWRVVLDLFHFCQDTRGFIRDLWIFFHYFPLNLALVDEGDSLPPILPVGGIGKNCHLYWWSMGFPELQIQNVLRPNSNPSKIENCGSGSVDILTLVFGRHVVTQTDTKKRDGPPPTPTIATRRLRSSRDRKGRLDLWFFESGVVGWRLPNEVV